jgi:hypothetical protein
MDSAYEPLASRAERPNLTRQAISALTLVTRSRIDYRYLNVDFPLFAVHQLDGDVDQVTRRAVQPLPCRQLGLQAPLAQSAAAARYATSR